MDYQEIILKVKEGEINPLKAYIELKAELKLIEETLEAIKDEAIDEAEKYGKGAHKVYGAEVEVRSAAGKWNYEDIKAYEDAKKKVSYIEKIAQAGGGVDTETGEEITAATKINGKTTIFIKQL